jgi:D-methionine transport system substrate-binding protein
MRFTSSNARLAGAAVAVVLTLGLSACSSSESDASGDGSSDDLGTIKIGALATPAGDIIKFVSDNLADDAGLTIEYTEFTDYNTPNVAVTDGSLDVYLPSAAFYSESLDSIDDLATGDTVAVPADPTNEGRALEILAAAGVIETTDKPTTLSDITETNGLEFIEVDNGTLAQSVPDVDAAFVTISFALLAGLTADDAILIESGDSAYSNVLVTTPELEDDPRVKKLYELLLSPETADYMNTTWGGLVIPTDK